MLMTPRGSVLPYLQALLPEEYISFVFSPKTTLIRTIEVNSVEAAFIHCSPLIFMFYLYGRKCFVVLISFEITITLLEFNSDLSEA